MIEQGIRSLLVAAGITTVYPVILPEVGATLPAVVYIPTTLTPAYSLDGPVGFIKARLQFECWASTYAEAKALNASVQAILDGYAGTLPDGTRVLNSWIVDGSDGVDRNSKLFRCTTTYSLAYAAS